MTAAIGSIVRHLLTIAGGALASKGVTISDSDSEILVGAASIILGVVWSLWEKRKRA